MKRPNFEQALAGALGSDRIPRPWLFGKALDDADSTINARISLHSEVDELSKEVRRLSVENDDLQERVGHDQLTGLLNRDGLEDAIRTLHHSELEGEPLRYVVVLIDLDDFKQINDTHGHDVGDYAIQAFAAILKASVRESDIVVRYGGDEFVLVRPAGDSDIKLEQRLLDLRLQFDALLDDMQQEPSLTSEKRGYLLSIRYSMGAAVGSINDIGRLKKEADDKMYHEKEMRRYALAEMAA